MSAEPGRVMTGGEHYLEADRRLAGHREAQVRLSVEGEVTPDDLAALAEALASAQAHATLAVADHLAEIVQLLRAQRR